MPTTLLEAPLHEPDHTPALLSTWRELQSVCNILPSHCQAEFSIDVMLILTLSTDASLRGEQQMNSALHNKA